MNKLIEQIIEEIKLIEQQNNLKIPNGYYKVSNTKGFLDLGGGLGMYCYLYYNPKLEKFFHIGIGPDGSTKIETALQDTYTFSEIYDNQTKTKADDIIIQHKYNKTGEYPIITNNPIKPKSINQNVPKTNKPIKANPISAVKTDPKEQRWVGIWEKFLVKYVGYNGGDKDNLTNDIDKAVYKFISQNKKLYQKNKNINLGNLEKLMTDGKKGPVHYSFLPPFYYKTDTFPIYFYQKSDKIKEIQAKLGVKQTGIFLNQTESAIVKNSKKYNITYSRKNGITKEIYDAIMKVNNIPSDINSLNTDINNYWGFEKREVKE